MGREVEEASNRLKDFLFERVYQSGGVSGAEAERVASVIKSLFRFYMEHPRQVRRGEGPPAGDDAALARLVCDYLAGMTDRFAVQQFEQHFLPRRWQGS